jgi:hypothetical protein
MQFAWWAGSEQSAGPEMSQFFELRAATFLLSGMGCGLLRPFWPFCSALGKAPARTSQQLWALRLLAFPLGDEKRLKPSHGLAWRWNPLQLRKPPPQAGVEVDSALLRFVDKSLMAVD